MDFQKAQVTFFPYVQALVEDFDSHWGDSSDVMSCKECPGW